jgi:hypothetical protein
MYFDITATVATKQFKLACSELASVFLEVCCIPEIQSFIAFKKLAWKSYSYNTEVININIISRTNIN